MVITDRVFYVSCLAFVVGYLLFFCSACGGTAADTARQTLATAARIANEIDKIEADAYDAAADRCLGSSWTPEAYSLCMDAHERVLRAEIVLRDSLLAAEHIVDAVEAGEAGSVTDGIPCAAAALGDLLRLLETMDIDLPNELTGAVVMLRAMASGRCAE